MQVNEIVTYSDYWNDVRFQAKKPNFFGSEKAAFGDNIYRRDESGIWQQLDSHHTNDDGSRCEDNVNKDTSCENVLISRNFAYWGGNGPILPHRFYNLIKRGPGHKSTEFSEEFKEQVVAWLHEAERGFLGAPREWGAEV